MRKRRGQKGLSLLEILLAIILLAMVIMATATVYPGGYKLNATNKMASQATIIAQAIVEEIKMRPFARVEVGSLNTYIYFSVQEMAERWRNNEIIDMCTEYRWPYHNDLYADQTEWEDNCPVLCWDKRGTLQAMYDFLKNEHKEFFLAEANNTLGVPPGIVVTGYGDGNLDYDDTEWAHLGPSLEPYLAKVQVSVSWIEVRNSEFVPKSVTVSSWITENKNE